MKLIIPNAQEITEHRMKTGCGCSEAKKQIIRDRVIVTLKNEMLSVNDLQDILLMILEERM